MLDPHILASMFLISLHIFYLFIVHLALLFLIQISSHSELLVIVALFNSFAVVPNVLMTDFLTVTFALFLSFILHMKINMMLSEI